MTSNEAETFSKHNFGNTGSLLKVEVNWWLINDLMARWDTIDRVFRFETIDLCSTIEKYSQILGVYYDTQSIIMPPLKQGFKMRMSKDLGIKKEILGLRIEINECTPGFSLQFVCQLRNLSRKSTLFQDFPGRMEPKPDTRF